MHKTGTAPEENRKKNKNVGRGKENSCVFPKVFLF